MIEFSGTIDTQSLVKAHRLQIARLVPFTVMISLAALYVLFTSARLNDPATWGIPLFFLLLAVSLFVSPYLAARTARRTNAALQSRVSGTADDLHFVFDSEFAHVDMPWSKFHRANIRPDLVLLYPSAGQAFIVSKHFFGSDDMWKDFCRVVAANVRQTPDRRPFLRTLLVWLAIIVAIFIVWSLFQRP